MMRAAGGPQSVDQVISQYVTALGGQSALDRIESRQVRAKHHGKLTYYWQKPDRILLIDGKEKTGWDGSSGWFLSSKKRVTKLPKGRQRPLEIDANPQRYAQLKTLYPDLEAAPSQSVDGKQMNVLKATNGRGATLFYFDSGTHLLARIEESGETSAYFHHSTGFSDYQPVDGVQFPFRIVHESDEPGAGKEEIRVAEVTQNVPINPAMFTRPSGSAVTMGGKR